MSTASSATTSPFTNIEYDARGVPYIAGTTMKVIELVTAQKAYGWSPEELHFQFPHISLAKVHSALAYYWDHQEEIDAEIERVSQFVENARSEVEAEQSKLVGAMRKRTRPA
jgi:uncharacterized protein (DUF433 family)